MACGFAAGGRIHIDFKNGFTIADRFTGRRPTEAGPTVARNWKTRGGSVCMLNTAVQRRDRIGIHRASVAAIRSRVRGISRTRTFSVWATALAAVAAVGPNVHSPLSGGGRSGLRTIMASISGTFENRRVG